MRECDLATNLRSYNAQHQFEKSNNANRFKKKTYNKTLLGDMANGSQSQVVLPKGKISFDLDDGEDNSSPRKVSRSATNRNRKSGEKQMSEGLSLLEQIDEVEEQVAQNNSMSKSGNKKEDKTVQQLDEAVNMLDKIAQLSNKKQGKLNQQTHFTKGKHQRVQSYNNRMSMYRRQPGQRGSFAQNNKTMTVYNPFAFNKQSINIVRNSMAADQVLGLNRVSKSIDFTAAGGLKALGAEDSNVNNSLMASQKFGIKPDNQLELVYQAMKKAQIAWEEQQQIGEEQVDDESSDSDVSHDGVPKQTEAIIESENFAIYSNFKFLLLIGKYCAKTREMAIEGLQALNDYLILLKYHVNNYTKEEFNNEKSLTIFYIGSIFYNQKDYYHAVEHLYPILEDLYKAKFLKELSSAERQISKIWRLNFNDKTVKQDYFSISNMENFDQLEKDRQDRFNRRKK